MPAVKNPMKRHSRTDVERRQTEIVRQIRVSLTEIARDHPALRAAAAAPIQVYSDEQLEVIEQQREGCPPRVRCPFPELRGPPTHQGQTNSFLSVLTAAKY